MSMTNTSDELKLLNLMLDANKIGPGTAGYKFVLDWHQKQSQKEQVALLRGLLEQAENLTMVHPGNEREDVGNYVSTEVISRAISDIEKAV